jgi:hypothetical protein
MGKMILYIGIADVQKFSYSLNNVRNMAEKTLGI